MTGIEQAQAANKRFEAHLIAEADAHWSTLFAEIMGRASMGFRSLTKEYDIPARPRAVRYLELAREGGFNADVYNVNKGFGDPNFIRLVISW